MEKFYRLDHLIKSTCYTVKYEAPKHFLTQRYLSCIYENQLISCTKYMFNAWVYPMHFQLAASDDYVLVYPLKIGVNFCHCLTFFESPSTKFYEKSFVKQRIGKFILCRCGPCHAIAPKLDELSQKYVIVNFLKVDVDRCMVSQ